MQNNETNITDAAPVADYSDDEHYDRRRAKITALLKWLECEFFGFFMFLSLFALTLVLKTKGYAIFGTLGVVAYITVMLDFGLKEGSRASIKNEARGDNVPRIFGLWLGLIAMIPALAGYVMLLVSYFGIIGSAVMPFKFLNLGLWGLISLFVKDMAIAHMSVHLLWFYPLLMLLMYPCATYIGFRIGYDKIDVRTKIMYKTK